MQNRFILLISGFAILLGFNSCGNANSDKNTALATPGDSSHSAPAGTGNTNIFEELRQSAFTASYQKPGSTLPSDQTKVYGVIMDWEFGGGIATTIAYQSGDASLYISSGGGIIGGIGHAKVRNSAKQLVTLAQTYLDKAIKTETTPLPMANEVQFYLLTNKGVFVGQDQIKNFENDSSPWFKLFELGNVLMKELRMTTEE